MSDENTFQMRAIKEIEQKIKDERLQLEKIQKESDELSRAEKGYAEFYEQLNNFFIESMQDFQVNEDNLPIYFKENIGEVYENYVQIRVDAITESENLEKYVEHCRHEILSNKRTLKFYRSQYMDSDFFKECLPLVEIYEKKINMYKENIETTDVIIKCLGKISDKLVGWN